MKNLWILLANSSHAIFFEVLGKGHKITELQRIMHPAGREKSKDLITDKPGRTAESAVPMKHALYDGSHVHRHEQNVFAHELVETLDKAQQQGLFQDLAVIAPAQFLGEIRKLMGHRLKDCLVKEISKDLPVSMQEKERIEHLRDYLDLWNPTGTI